jgi:hypothetical protein
MLPTPGPASRQCITAGSVSHLTVAGIIGAVLLALLVWSVSRHGGRGLVTGALVGLAVVAGWAVTGIVGFDEFEPTQLQSLSFVAPVGEGLQYLMIFTGVSANYVIALLGGVLAGAFGSALIGGRVRFKGFQSEGSLLRYIAGGVLMGFGGVTALGCSVGQGLSGLSTGVLRISHCRTGHCRGGYATMAVQARRGVQQTGKRIRTPHCIRQSKAASFTASKKGVRHKSGRPHLILMSFRLRSGEHVRGD